MDTNKSGPGLCAKYGSGFCSHAMSESAWRALMPCVTRHRGMWYLCCPMALKAGEFLRTQPREKNSPPILQRRGAGPVTQNKKARGED